MTAMVCIVRHPAVQLHVQAELDFVVGQTRLPNFSDCEKLSYLHCVILEAIRFAIHYAMSLIPSIDPYVM